LNDAGTLLIGQLEHLGGDGVLNPRRQLRRFQIRQRHGQFGRIHIFLYRQGGGAACL